MEFPLHAYANLVPTYDPQAGGRLELRAVRIVGGHGVFRNMVTNETIADGTEANYPPGTLVGYVTIMLSTLQPCLSGFVVLSKALSFRA